MRVVVLYHPKSDHEGLVLDYVHDYQRFRGKKLELLSLDTRDGAHLAELHDLTQYPTILATAEDGSAQKFWQGLPLPLMNELDEFTADYRPSFARAELLAI